MSRKNWDRFFPSSKGDAATGPGWQRWLLASAFVFLMTGAVVVVKVNHSETGGTGESSDTGTPTNKAEESSFLEEPKPVGDVVEAQPEPAAVPAPTTPSATAVEPKAPEPVPVVPAPIPEVAPPPTQPVGTSLAPVSPAPPPPPAPSATLMPPEAPPEVVHQVAAPPVAEMLPPSPPMTPAQAAGIVAAPNTAFTAVAPPPAEPEAPRQWGDPMPPPAALHNAGSLPPANALTASAPPTVEEVPPPAPPVPVQPPLPPSPTVTPEPAPLNPSGPAPVPAPPVTPVPTPTVPPPPPPTCTVQSPPSVPSRPAPLPLPEFAPSVPKTQVQATPAPLPLTGCHSCTLDRQSEVTLPAVVRKRLEGSHILYVALAPDQQCLWVYTTADLERLNEKLEQLPGGEERVRRCRRLCFSRMQQVSVEDDGHMVLPGELVQAAGLNHKLVLIGARDHFELWDAERWDRYCEPGEK